MTDLRDRMRIYDQAPAPDYWNEVELRASTGAMGAARTDRSSRPMLLLVAAALLALAIGGAVLVLSGVVVPPDSSASRLAYSLDGDIYLADADGANPVLVADGDPPGPACGTFWGEGSMWSPDGRYFAYRSNAVTDTGGACPYSVYLRDAEGRSVSSFPGYGWRISWSPDSTRVATWVEPYLTVGIYGIDGVRQALLTPPPGCVGGGDHDPLWSTDGRSVVAGACDMPIDGRTPEHLPDDDPRSGFHWAYSPDGTRVANASYDSGSLVIAETDGTELVVLSDGIDRGPDEAPTEVYLYPVWSPSGDRVAFLWSPWRESGDLTASELRVVKLATGEVTTIATGPTIQPIAFSAAGDRILYATHGTSSLRTGLWSINADGSDEQLLVQGTGWGDWRPATLDQGICLVGCEGIVSESPSPSPALLARGNFVTNVGEVVELEATREGSNVTGRMTVSAEGQNEPYAFTVDLQCARTTEDGLVMIGGVTTDSTGQEAPQEGTWAGIVLERGSPVGASTWRSGGESQAASCLAFLDEQDMRERLTHPGADTVPRGDWTDPIEGAVELGP